VDVDGGETALPYQSLVYLLGTLKNLTDEEKARQQATGLIIAVSPLLPAPAIPLPVDYVNNSRAQVMIQTTGILRNYAGDKAFVSDMLVGKVVERGLRTLDLFFAHPELVFNTSRVLSKLSMEEQCCRIMLDKSNLYSSISLLQRVLLTYSEHAAVVSRLGFTLANLAMLYEEVRAVLGAEGFDALTDTILLSYAQIEGMSRTHFDALLKTIRLLANVVMDAETGAEMLKGSSAIASLMKVLQVYMGQHEEMTLITVSCLANILYYDYPSRPVVPDVGTRVGLVRLLAPCLVQTDNFEITREALRALSNLTRHEIAAKEIGQIHAIEPLMLLLDHSSPEVVFYSLGCLTNISHLAKELIYSEYYFERFIALLSESYLEAIDISLQVSMTLSNLCSPTKGLVPWEGVAGEEAVKRLNNLIGAIITEGQEIEGAKDLLSVLKTLKEAMPEDLLPCPVKGCGRKFASQEKLKEHWERRHNE
jgi:hypothetical protein